MGCGLGVPETKLNEIAKTHEEDVDKCIEELFKVLLQWNPQSGHSEIRTPRYRGQFLPSQILHLCTFQPLKSGHPANQGTFLGPKVSKLEGFHCSARFRYKINVLVLWCG